jgi:hypothetical protein
MLAGAICGIQCEGTELKGSKELAMPSANADPAHLISFGRSCRVLLVTTMMPSITIKGDPRYSRLIVRFCWGPLMCGIGKRRLGLHDFVNHRGPI